MNKRKFIHDPQELLKEGKQIVKEDKRNIRYKKGERFQDE